MDGLAAFIEAKQPDNANRTLGKAYIKLLSSLPTVPVPYAQPPWPRYSLLT
jgi:hypothetical protein